MIPIVVTWMLVCIHISLIFLHEIWQLSNQMTFLILEFFLKKYIFIADIEFIEKKAFEVCDTDDDGGLSWPEVKICEVCM